MASSAPANSQYRTRVLAAAGRSGWIYGAAGPLSVVFHSVVIPGGTIQPGSSLNIQGMLTKYAPYNGGGALQVKFKQGANSVIFAQNSLNASIAGYRFMADCFFSYDLKWGFCPSLNMFATPTVAAIATYTDYATTNSPPSSKSPRAKSSANIAFASYTAPPTVETILIDFSKDVTLSIEGQIAANDCVEVLNFTVEMIAPPNAQTNYANLIATVFPGDSLTEGTGNTAGNDYISQLGRLRPGRPLLNEGLGGQGISQIVDRVLADPVCGSMWDMVLWAGINNADPSNGGADWWNVIKTNTDRLLAFRAPGARTIICNITPNNTWSAPYFTALSYVNAQIAARYGTKVCDLYSAIATDPGGMVPTAYTSSAPHLNDTGYGVVAATVNAKMTSLGWA